ncbi:hypothetical protein E2C01_053140 [Portunus trituberculatus]|uniref:Secreted protein n=1 Tax=Portunus trituberculatus TaxID=210409 RepID=A0A5B7GNP7_PORTR|nr:hypothetical protein [Portunus trituberculatus]
MTCYLVVEISAVLYLSILLLRGLHCCCDPPSASSSGRGRLTIFSGFGACVSGRRTLPWVAWGGWGGAAGRLLSQQLYTSHREQVAAAHRTGQGAATKYG